MKATMAKKLSQKAEDHNARSMDVSTLIEIYATHETYTLEVRKLELEKKLEAIKLVLDARTHAVPDA